MFWWAVAFVTVYAIAYMRIPKSQKPVVGTVESPTAEEGRPIPILFGERDITQSNVVYYGDIETEAVKKKGGKK